MNGKTRCRILKAIRKEIAKNNDIEYVTTECKYKGDCAGTCPKCEAEVRYLEQELEKRRKLGKSVAVAGIAATMAVAGTGCEGIGLFNPELGGAPMDPPSKTVLEGEPVESLSGDVAIPGDGEIMGVIALPEDGELETGETEAPEEDPTDGEEPLEGKVVAPESESDGE